MAAPGIITAPPQTLLGLANAWTQKQTLSAGVSIASAASLDWNSDLFLFRAAANVLAQRNGTNAQGFHVYNTFTDASDYERGSLAWSSNQLAIGVQIAGTGSARRLRLQTGTDMLFDVGALGTPWQISSTGHFNSPNDNTYDIGGNGANRPRNIFIAGYTKKTPVAVASLPAAATAGAGAELLVNDALAPAFGATVVGSGTVTVPVFSDGTNWKVG